MIPINRTALCSALAIAFLGMPLAGWADTSVPAKVLATPSGGLQLLDADDAVVKAASARSVASRATSTTSITVYGGFELQSPATVYILVRGNSLGSLGVTPFYLDAPRVRLYNNQGVDQVTQGGLPGFNGCLASATTDAPVVNYYQNVRGQPVHSRDSCIAVLASAGAFTFSVTPSTSATSATFLSSPPSGEMLFEVTLGP
jgi:hypothetical protein